MCDNGGGNHYDRLEEEEFHYQRECAIEEELAATRAALLHVMAGFEESEGWRHMVHTSLNTVRSTSGVLELSQAAREVLVSMLLDDLRATTPEATEDDIERVARGY